MAFPTIKAAQTLGEFKQVFRWDIDFSVVASTYPKWRTDTGTTIAASAIDASLLSLTCQSTEEPVKDIEYARADLRGTTIFQAGIGNVSGELPLTFLDTMDNLVMDLFEVWANAAFNTSNAAAKEAVNQEKGAGWANALSNGNAKQMPEYKINALNIYRLDGRLKKWYGCSLNGVSAKRFTRGGSLESRSSEISKPQLILQYDAWWRIPVA